MVSDAFREWVEENLREAGDLFDGLDITATEIFLQFQSAKSDGDFLDWLREQFYLAEDVWEDERQAEAECPRCHGSGGIPEARCLWCRGTGVAA